MNKYQIAPILLVILFVGALGAGYQFYYREQLETYAQNEARRDALEQKLRTLTTTFSDETGNPVEPEVVIAQWREVTQPWTEALNRRSTLFAIDVFDDPPRVPEGELPRFFYEQEIEARYQALAQYVRQNRVQHNPTTFDVPFSLAGQTVEQDQVERWLRRFAFGDAVTRQLIDANARVIYQITLWPPRVEFGILEKRTVGTAFMMRLPELVAFLEDLASEERYVNVEGLRIVNPSMRTPASPYLEVEMLLTYARVLSEDEQREAAARPAATRDRSGFGGGMSLEELRERLQGSRD